jgi:hypothetical protein
MTQKDELAILAARTVLDLAHQSEIEWDKIYFRFYSAEEGHSSFEFTYQKGRTLEPVRSTKDHRDLLRKLMFALFDQAEQEAGTRPQVAIVEVQADQSYQIEFNYDDPNALDISLPGLGTPASYFAEDAVDIPEEVKEFQRNMTQKELAEMPRLYTPSKN